MKAELSMKYIENSNPKSFKYGTLDCALWAFKYVKTVNGLDLYSKYVGKYKTWAGGRSALRKQGDVSLINYLNNNFEIMEMNFAQRGDLVMYKGAVGICQGKYSFFLNEKNVAHRLTEFCGHAWRVEEKCPR